MGEVHVHCTLVHVHGGADMAAVLVVKEVSPQQAYRGTSLIRPPPPLLGLWYMQGPRHRPSGGP